VSRRRGPTPKRGTHRATSRQDTLDAITLRLDGCSVINCANETLRWFPRNDLQERRLVVYPSCWLHLADVAEMSCPDVGSCLAPPDDHASGTAEEIGDAIFQAFGHGWGVGFPLAGDALDVIRPGRL
jgi:hypothetical protein